MKKQDFLTCVEKKIKDSLSWDEQKSGSAEPDLAAAAAHICLAAGAKRARPKLAYYFGLSLQPKWDLLVDVAVTAELIHGASLLHDDVIDNGELRRGVQCAHIKWNPLTAVLAGDLLLAESIKGLWRCPRVVAQEALNVVADMTRSTMLEAHIRGSTDVPIEQWSYIAMGKTSTIFRWCGRSVAHLSTDDEALERYGTFGEHFGVAFQLADDLLDLQHTNSGKTQFADIRNRNPSYPLIIAQQRSAGFQQDLRKAWSKEHLTENEVKALGAAAIATGAADQCFQTLQLEVEQAIDALGHYAQRPGCREIAEWVPLLWKRIKRPEAG